VVGNVVGVAVPPELVYFNRTGHVVGMQVFMSAELLGSALFLSWSFAFKNTPPTAPTMSALEKQRAVRGCSC
jgi:hypothetical protein